MQLLHVGGLWSHSATESVNQHMIDRIGRYLGYTCMPKLTWIRYPMIPNSAEKDRGSKEKCGVVHLGSIQWLTCRAISAFTELLILLFLLWYFQLMMLIHSIHIRLIVYWETYHMLSFVQVAQYWRRWRKPWKKQLWCWSASLRNIKRVPTAELVCVAHFLIYTVSAFNFVGQNVDVYFCDHSSCHSCKTLYILCFMFLFKKLNKNMFSVFLTFKSFWLKRVMYVKSL